jgi:hypothetical protein
MTLINEYLFASISMDLGNQLQGICYEGNCLLKLLPDENSTYLGSHPHYLGLLRRCKRFPRFHKLPPAFKQIRPVVTHAIGQHRGRESILERVFGVCWISLDK